LSTKTVVFCVVVHCFAGEDCHCCHHLHCPCRHALSLFHGHAPRVLALVLQQLVPALTPSLPKNRASPETISDFNFSFNKIQWMIDVS
jgi:hypothetical protein